MDFTSGGRQNAPDRVPLVRVETEEKVYDREAVLGRDVTSVFPNEAAPDDPTSGFQEALGAVKFVTETELAAIKKGRGERVEDGTVESLKSLADVLAENKQAKEDEFQEKWKQMKTGKNRPLDEEEIEFFEELHEQEKQKNQAVKEQEEEALLSFQVAQAQMEERVTKVAEPVQMAASISNPAPLAHKRKPKPLAGLVRVKPSASSKKARLEEPEPQVEQQNSSSDDEGGAGLGGLLAYGSSDDDN
mmetsp:Transcript_40357/g.48923  ORF Transcript_40357/g.48923 Transcript_40357/m.48923 type:complete len:246 (-) Transcript_40357:127-864(-)|eukprot:CAMPEP_0197846612 /NCGR_PEP_ID=MMETSP1438-20131217/3713_1 /TAXON_ID=1461541 /ORGANISM="Pterosperma sp., Strain CCMP1384" /LENGTH=245 /DNA_ID=CAMNT_0043458319 /DNA_START=281 /DNA_END=1018 /DNA_ORIENTATION=+